MRNIRITLATLAVGASVAFAGPALAEKLKARLDGASETPPTTSTGKGTADIDYDAATRKLTWKLTYWDWAPRPRRISMARRTWARAPASPSPIPNVATKPGRRQRGASPADARAADLPAGKYYVNIHTAANPDGEIRGQVTK